MLQARYELHERLKRIEQTIGRLPQVQADGKGGAGELTAGVAYKS